MRSGGGFNRRSLLIGASAVGGGLALGFAVPFEVERSAVSAQAAAAPEITCWLTIARDDAAGMIDQRALFHSRKDAERHGNRDGQQQPG